MEDWAALERILYDILYVKVPSFSASTAYSLCCSFN